MTFTEIVTEIQQRLSAYSTEAETRIGRAVNRLYRSVTTTTGLNTTRTVLGSSAVVGLGTSYLTFTSVEKVYRVYYTDSGTVTDLQQLTLTQMREERLGTGVPTKWAVQDSGATSVTVRVNSVVQANTTLYADGYTTVSDLANADVPVIPISFHDILIEGVLIDEYKKQGKRDYSQDSAVIFEKRLSELRYFIAKNAYLDIYQGASQNTTGSGSSGGSSGSALGGQSYTQTGLITFDRDPDVPFAVTASSAVVPNLDADKLDGFHETSFAKIADNEDITGFWTFTSTPILGNAQPILRTNTNDGSDTKSVTINAGGDEGLDRGGRLVLGGNEHASTPGLAALQAGNVAGGKVALSRGDGGHALEVASATGLITLGYGQIKFPAAQNASTDVNTIDDYEEGSWTPTITGTGGSSGQTYSLQAGRYVKVGKKVFVTGRVTLTALGTVTTQAAIGGLPFTAENTIGIDGTLHIGFWAAMTSSFVYLAANVIANGTVASISGATAAATGLSSVVQGDLSNTTDLVFSGTYIAAA